MLPRAMVTGCVVSYAIGLVGLISFLFNLGPLDDSLYRYGGQPWVAVIYRITGSRAATIVLILVIAVNVFHSYCPPVGSFADKHLQFFCLQMNCVMTSSRQLWAFARDKGIPFLPSSGPFTPNGPTGIPFHTFFARVAPDGLPRNAVLLTLTFASLLSLIIIGSSTAFNVFLSFGNAGIMTSYTVIIACLIYRRFDGNEWPETKFSLGKLGLPINCAALAYLAVALTFVFFPAAPEPSAASMNWASLMFGNVLIISFVWYFLRAKHEYDGPVEYVRKEL